MNGEMGKGVGFRKRERIEGWMGGGGGGEGSRERN